MRSFILADKADKFIFVNQPPWGKTHMPAKQPSNAYPELPEVPFKATSVAMQEVNDYIATIPYIAEVKRTVQVIFRNESGNGKSGLNNNYIGQQADGGRLPAKWVPFLVGTFVKKENMTGKLRRFVAFLDWKTSVALLADRVFERGIYIGENVDSKYFKGTVKTVDDLAMAYWDEWVVGEVNDEPPADFAKDFKSMYKQAKKLFA
jgi:hypothetical protein